MLKGSRIGTVESLDNAQDTKLWSSATEDMQTYFSQGAQSLPQYSEQTPPEQPRSTKSRVSKIIQTVKDTLIKPRGSRAVTVNDSDDITPQQIAALKEVLARHEALFSDHLGLVREPEEDWLRISLLPGTEQTIKPQKQYRLSPKEKEAVDSVFDEQRRQGRLIDSPPSPAGWPVFVVKKGAKWRPVVDLCGLNKIIAPDAYPLPRQDDITNAIRGHYWLSIFDMLSAYYQRRVHPADIWKLAMSTHRGHEAWAVAPMGLSISVPHQQRYMDKLLQHFRWRVACCFIDDTIVFSYTFEEHLRDIDEILTTFELAGLTIQPYKCFVGFHSLKILGQLVDRFGLTTTEERASAICDVPYPKTLSALEHFLGACGYNRYLVPYYAQITAPLQALKTRSFKGSPKSGRARKKWADGHKLPMPSDAQKKSFELVKKIIGSRETMHHPNYDMPFYWYVDASREWGYGIAVYQDNPLSEATGHFKQVPVMFLSRELKLAEKNYWPIELEAGALV